MVSISSAPDVWLVDERAGVQVDWRNARLITSRAVDAGMRRASRTR